MTPRTEPTRDDWARFRPLVYHLYRSRDWTLQEVSEYFQRRGYYIT